ncbi:MAG TPA: DUF1349 domain-containing protein [Streptosporangiaceae bacterium]
MSAEIRAWLDELQAGDPATAGAVGQALIALAELGPALGPPLVRPLPAAWSPGTDPREALDDAYSERLERTQVLRRGVAEAADVRTAVQARIAELATCAEGSDPEAAGATVRESAELKALVPGLNRAEQRLTEASRRMQADTEWFRVRKETLKAAYTAAEAEREIAGLLRETGDGQPDELTAAEAAARMAETESQMSELLSGEAGPARLLELRPGRPGEPGNDVSLIFAVEPAGTALLISVVHGDDALRYEWRQAAEVAAEVLRRVRAGQDPAASAARFADAAAFAAAVVPAGGTGAWAGAAPAASSAGLTLPWLPFPLAAEGHPACEYRILAGALELTSAAGTDLFIDPAGAGQPPDAGRLLGPPPPGDFTLSARVSVGFGSTFDAGVLLVHAGERRWAKLCFELSPQLRPTAVTVVTRDTSDDCNSFEVTGDTLWLRICRSGQAWAFHASTDGSWWRLLRYFGLDGPDPVRVGFLAQSPGGPGCTATFAAITFRPGAPSDLRDGS